MGTIGVNTATGTLSARLLDDVPGLAAEMAVRIMEQEPMYRDPAVIDPAELERSCRENIVYILTQLAGLPAPDTVAARTTGSLRADQGIPIDAVLQAFRVGARFLWEVLVDRADEDTRDSLLPAAADIWAVSDRLAVDVTDAYRATAAARAQIDRQVREAVLDALLVGSSDHSPSWDSAHLLRLPQEGRFVVVAAECPGPGADALPAVESLLREENIASAWRLAADMQEGAVSLRPRFGQHQLADLLRTVARGRVGISGSYGRLVDTPVALREARLACRTVTPGETDVGVFEDEPVGVLLAGSPDAARNVARRVLGRVLDLPIADRRQLLETTRVWLAEGGSTMAAARRLHLHRNGVRYRLNRLEELTGRQLSAPADAADVHIALESVRILGLG